ncbi:uncharacterized protein LOC133850166 isoform X2 [Drosophila sulfurigaster albostrigata]|uniref:uncharacterized protein LOC133850166 isoform X2 n=1 Tax=Drosophila sulfurigaster albostrigata TaxID=89887 RepID=UPI002D21D510|nr:uncharacterized protein LOC133850166 isoform X2 [Drosophila sulfurigaster albostrigata]
MVFSVRNLLCLTILAVLASTGYAIHCYHCDSLFNSKCGQEFEADAGNLFDCSRVTLPRYLSQYFQVRNATGCMKKVLELPGDQLIIRSCYFGDVNNKEGCQSDKALPPVKVLACDICTKDNCNGSG